MSLADDHISSKQFIDTNRHQIIRDQDLLTKALIILRLDGFYDEAITLGLDAARLRPLSRRNRYELALLHVSTGRCDLAVPYFRHLSINGNDWLAEDSKRFLRECSRNPNLTWVIDLSAGYDQNLAQSGAQHTITAEPASELYRMIEEIESHLSGVSISHDFTLGDRHVAGWYTETYASLGYVIPRQRNRYHANLLLYERLTSPRGYDHHGVGVSAMWQHQMRWALLESKISLKRLENQRGRNRESVIRYQTHANQAILFPLSDISYMRMTVLGALETYPRHSDRSLRDQGIAIGYHHKNPLMLGADRTKAWWHNWYAEISRSKRTAIPHDQSSDRLGITGSIHLMPPNGNEKLWIQLNMTKETLLHPRPWRLHPHNLWHVTGRLAFTPDWFEKYALTLELNWENTRSKDILDERDKWNFILRYQLDNAKR